MISIRHFLVALKEDTSTQPKQMLLYMLTFFFFCLLFIGLIIYFNTQNSRFAVTQEEIQKQTAFIQEVRNKEQDYETKHQAQAKPVKKNDVDTTQSVFINQTKNYNLQIVSLSAVNVTSNDPKAPPQDGAEFELGLVGPWDMTAKFIEEIKKGTVLIAIKSLRIEADSNENQVKTTLKYKIYTE